MYPETDMGWLQKECSQKNSLAELLPLAMAELQKFPEGAEVVCGPINGGGQENLEKNLKVFRAAIETLKKQGHPVFSQVPYEERIFFFREQWRQANPARTGDYFLPVLEEFYYPLFQTRLIKKGWFVSGWDSSFGARWKRHHLVQVGATIDYLSPEQIDVVILPE